MTFLPFLLLLAASLLGAAPPADWVPVRWEGGPLEQQRLQAAGTPVAEEAQAAAIRDWYREENLALLEGTPFNCLLLSWSNGGGASAESAPRQAVAAFAQTARAKGLATLGVIFPGRDWLAAVEAAAKANLDGVVLEGEFPPAAAGQALDILQKSNPRAVAVPMGPIENAPRGERFPILASNAGLWPGMLSADEASGWGAGPTSNPWVLSNAWRAGALRARDPKRPAWMGHRPKRHRDQPIELREYLRAVADSAMAGGRWVVALEPDWRARLAGGDNASLDSWRQLAALVAYFEANKQWRDYPAFPGFVVVDDPQAPSAFAHGDLLNMLAVRQIPHKVVLRSDFAGSPLEETTAVVAFDAAPPSDTEHTALQDFTNRGGTLLLGPHWVMTKFKSPDRFKRLIAGKGTILSFTAADVKPDEFSRNARHELDEHHAGPKLYNVGSIMSWYSVDPAADRTLLQLTEYGDYPTENVTVRFGHKIARAQAMCLGREPEELEIYEEEDDAEFVIPEVPGYCAVTIE